MGCAAALATIAVYEEDGLIERAAAMGKVMARHHPALMEKHPSVGSCAIIGLFGMVDVVRSREPYEPMAPYNGTSDEMKALGRSSAATTACTRCTLERHPHEPAADHHRGAAARGFEIIDRALEVTDAAVA